MLLTGNRFDYKPLVSVCILCYKHAPYLTDLFDSLLAQTYRNLEIIFVDDCSPDESFALAKSYETRLKDAFANVTIQQNSVNLGMHLTGEVAASQATGEYMCSMDGDDYYHPTRFGYCVSYLNTNSHIGAVHSDFYHDKDGQVADSGFFKTTSLNPVSGWGYDALLQENTVGHLTLMVRKNLYRQCYKRILFQERGYMMTDYPAVLGMSKLTEFGYIPEPLAYYRVLANSASHDTKKSQAFRDSVMLIRQHARLGLL